MENYHIIDTTPRLSATERQIFDKFVPCEPPRTTRQSVQRIMYNAKTGKPFVGKIKRGNAVENLFKRLFYQYRPSKPIDFAISVQVAWIYTPPKTLPKYIKEKVQEVRHQRGNADIFLACDKRPDCENLLKAFDDCLTELGFWLDDALECRISFVKCYGIAERESGIRLTIAKIEDL